MVLIEQDVTVEMPKNYYVLRVLDIIAGAVKRDIPARNLFLSFLKGLFDYPYP